MAKQPFGLKTPVKHHHAAVALASAVLIFLVLLNGQVSRAAGVKYNFIARGIVVGFDEADKSVTLDITKATGRGKDDLNGTRREMKVGSAKVYKVVSAKDKRVTYHNLAIGQELGIKGQAKDDDSFELSFIRIHDRSFTIIGRLSDHNTATRSLTLSVTSSTYKNSAYKGKEITMTYPEDAKFYEKKTTTGLVFDDLDSTGQPVKVTGTLTGSNTWEVRSLINNYTGK